MISKYVLNPWVWLCRIPHRCGYGVHSPYAFDFITGVIYEKSAYYAYSELDSLLPRLQVVFRLRQRKLLHLLFRLVNFAEPQRALVLGATPLAYAFMKAARTKAQWAAEMPRQEGQAAEVLRQDRQSEMYDFIYVDGDDIRVLDYVHPDSMLVVDDLQHHLPFWEQIKQHTATILTFDLYDVGVVMFNPRFNRMDYVVNF